MQYLSITKIQRAGDVLALWSGEVPSWRMVRRFDPEPLTHAALAVQTGTTEANVNVGLKPYRVAGLVSEKRENGFVFFGVNPVAEADIARLVSEIGKNLPPMAESRALNCHKKESPDACRASVVCSLVSVLAKNIAVVRTLVPTGNEPLPVKSGIKIIRETGNVQVSVSRALDALFVAGAVDRMKVGRTTFNSLFPQTMKILEIISGDESDIFNEIKNF